MPRRRAREERRRSGCRQRRRRRSRTRARSSRACRCARASWARSMCGMATRARFTAARSSPPGCQMAPAPA
eukprot:4470531-Heterocapsa_arctica.AAC.1